MNEQISKMAIYALNQMPREVRNEVYYQLQSEHIKEDVLQLMRNDGISLSMEGVEAVVRAYQRDCHLSYWGDLQSLIEKTHKDELVGNAAERIPKEYLPDETKQFLPRKFYQMDVPTLQPETARTDKLINNISGRILEEYLPDELIEEETLTHSNDEMELD